MDIEVSDGTIEGVLLQGSVIVTGASSVQTALSSGYGAKLRKSIVVPKYQSECLLGEPVPHGAAGAAAEEVGSLTLSEVEAAYLALSGKLTVRHPEGSQCSLSELWDIFEKKNPKFVSILSVYIFYRKKGYHVRGGINFGVDFAVYRDHPTRCHSEMCVLVVPAEDTPGAGVENMSWRHLAALTRVMPDVMKLMILCYVVREDSLCSMDAGGEYSFEYMQKFRVRPVTAISRRLNNRSDDFATIGNIQKKYRQLNKLVAVRKFGTDTNKKRKRRGRKLPDEVRDKRQKIESNASTEVIGKGVQKGDSCADIKANQPGEDLSTSSWGDYFRSFFLSSPP